MTWSLLPGNDKKADKSKENLNLKDEVVDTFLGQSTPTNPIFRDLTEFSLSMTPEMSRNPKTRFQLRDTKTFFSSHRKSVFKNKKKPFFWCCFQESRCFGQGVRCVVQGRQKQTNFCLWSCAKNTSGSITFLGIPWPAIFVYKCLSSPTRCTNSMWKGMKTNTVSSCLLDCNNQPAEAPSGWDLEIHSTIHWLIPNICTKMWMWKTSYQVLIFFMKCSSVTLCFLWRNYFLSEGPSCVGEAIYSCPFFWGGGQSMTTKTMQRGRHGHSNRPLRFQPCGQETLNCFSLPVVSCSHSGIRAHQKFAETKAFKEAGIKLISKVHPLCKSHPADSDDYWRCYIRSDTFGDYHPTSTCKMGKEEGKASVVDPQLRYRCLPFNSK